MVHVGQFLHAIFIDSDYHEKIGQVTFYYC